MSVLFFSFFCNGKFQSRLPLHPICVPFKRSSSDLQSDCGQSIIAEAAGWLLAAGAGGHRGHGELRLHLSRGCCRTGRRRVPVSPENTGLLHTSRSLSRWCHHLQPWQTGGTKGFYWSESVLLCVQLYEKCEKKRSYLRPGNPRRCHPVRFSAGCSWSSAALSVVGWSCLAWWCQAQPLGCWSDWLSHHPSPLEDI